MNETLAAIRGVLRTTPTRWLALTAQIAPALLERPPAPGEWAAIDCLRHLLDLETRIFAPRLHAMLAGQGFPCPAPAAAAGVATPAELAAAFARRRTGTLKRLAGLESADLQRAAEHPELGLVTVDNLLHDWAVHDLLHTIQAEQAVMQPFLPGTGPWRQLFRDNDLSDCPAVRAHALEFSCAVPTSGEAREWCATAVCRM